MFSVIQMNKPVFDSFDRFDLIRKIKRKTKKIYRIECK